MRELFQGRSKTWERVPSGKKLGKNSVHVWTVSFRKDGCDITQFLQYLSADEIMKAERFRFEKDKKRFMTMRSVLRNILCSYLEIGAADIEFCYNQFGKPFISETINPRNISFNASSSHGVALIAIALEKDIGIDIEYISRDCEHVEIASEFFSDREQNEFLTLTDATRIEAFYNCWTRKEAFVKAMGEGLSFSLKDFDVSLAPNYPARILDIRNIDQKAADWNLIDINAGCGYKAALAVKGDIGELRYNIWNYKWLLPCRVERPGFSEGLEIMP
jgi:4'-phosphopantetheinyl transferase